MDGNGSTLPMALRHLLDPINSNVLFSGAKFTESFRNDTSKVVSLNDFLNLRALFSPIGRKIERLAGDLDARLHGSHLEFLLH